MASFGLCARLCWTLSIAVLVFVIRSAAVYYPLPPKSPMNDAFRLKEVRNEKKEKMNEEDFRMKKNNE